MRKSIIIVLTILCALPLSAQVKFGVEAGVNLSHYLSSQSSVAEQNGGMKMGFQVGATVDYELGKDWLLMSGLSFQQNRSNMKLGYFHIPYFPKTEVKINNLVLPMKIGYKIRISDKLSLIPSFGGYLSYGFSAGSCSLDIIHPSDDKATISTTTWKPMEGYTYLASEHPTPNHVSLQAFRPWTYGAIGGIKAIVSDHYTVGLDYSVGIKKVQKQNDLRNSSFQLSVGYRF